jgi:F0F1-type ATP synthase assembly protein I
LVAGDYATAARRSAREVRGPGSSAAACFGAAIRPIGLESSPMPEKPSIESELSSTSKKKGTLVSLARYSEMGFIIPSATLLGFFLGKLADYWLHTKWLYLVGLLFGAGVGFWQMIRMAIGANKDQ